MGGLQTGFNVKGVTLSNERSFFCNPVLLVLHFLKDEFD